MLTRLHVKGFKNLFDTEVRFGPFTCIAGLNGVGKSNLFDAIAFVSDLANHSIVEAASRVRGNASALETNLSSLFTRKSSTTWYDIEIDLDFLVPSTVIDDFGRAAEPSASFLNYQICLHYISNPDGGEQIKLLREDLTYITKSESKKRLGFKTSPAFLDSVTKGEKRTPFISTVEDKGVKAIWLRQDKLPGAPLKINLAATPRTALSTANTSDRPTALAARREMQSWMQLQLEPSKLRSSDRFSNEEDKQRLTSDGAHLPATLLRLNACDQVAMMVSKLLPDIRGLRIDVNKESRLQTLYMQQIDGTEHAARALSDGTLRFLALSTLACDDLSTGVICMEEPENGIHPARIPAILDLLREMAVDTDEAVGVDNPLRQVIINTHSPSVIKALSPNELVVASSVRWNNQNVTCFGFIQGNENEGARVMWRSDVIAKGIPAPSVTVGKLIAYLGNIKIAHAVPVQPKTARDIENWAQGKLQLDGLIE